MEIKSLEILISTLNDGVFNIKLNKEYDVLIVHQITNGKMTDYESYYNQNIASERVRYIQSNTIGLSKSRNIALKNSCGKYLWIMDDDVEVLDNLEDRIVECFESNHCDIVILNHFFSNQEIIDTREKQFHHNKISAAGICSIDICMRREVNKSIFFDENFGLGTSLPSGEEYIFITDALDNGYKVYQSNILSSTHPEISSGLDFFSTSNKVRAKKAMFKRVFKRIGSVMMFCFFIKKIPLLIKKRKVLFFAYNAFIK
ncbi:glycosyltransferase family A protein [Symbiopectobacterium purcellii]|uniref:Glycosyltransferase family 2 protein n=1 Tax=Symbiopectobacterium purcellii TaxID=2871826 RepID=A0ABX9AUE7_9ENTR|nr:glycosyltransferase family A protein [Symbiopectobacterium purcellii]QZN97074.1 glycosyltransferase family 2 protein [Symbiopectobacterium purcellii]